MAFKGHIQVFISMDNVKVVGSY